MRQLNKLLLYIGAWLLIGVWIPKDSMTYAFAFLACFLVSWYVMIFKVLKI